jgi:hypothetical protein
MKLCRLFRAEVPKEVVEEFYKCLDISLYQTCRWFSKYDFTEERCEKLEGLLPVLEEYYYPHKHFLLHREMTPVRYIQILKQLAEAVDYKLVKREAKGIEVNRIKTTLYRLESHLPKQVTASFTVTFD